MMQTGSEASFPPVSDLVPHDGTMVLLDKVLSADLDSICAEVRIQPQTLFCDTSVQPSGVGAWVGIEYMAQAVAAHAGYLAQLSEAPVKVGFLLGSRRYEAMQALFALGSTLHVHAHRVLQGDNGLGAFECRIDDQSSGATLATATVTVFQPDNVNEFLQRSEV